MRRGNGRLGDWPIKFGELATWTCVVVNVAQPLQLRGGGAGGMGIPSDFAHSTDDRASQTAALWMDDDKPAGLIYPPRLHAETNIAVYDRVPGKLAADQARRLINCSAPELQDLQSG